MEKTIPNNVTSIDTIRAEHERGIIGFLSGTTKERISRLMNMNNKRKSVMSLLDHDLTFDENYTRELIGSEKTKGEMINILKRIDGEAYIMSTVKRIDGRFFSRDEGIDAILSSFGGTYASFIPGKLAIFKYEDGRCLFLHK